MKFNFKRIGNTIIADCVEVGISAVVEGYQFNFMDELHIKTCFGVEYVDDDCKEDFFKINHIDKCNKKVKNSPITNNNSPFGHQFAYSILKIKKITVHNMVFNTI